MGVSIAPQVGSSYNEAMWDSTTQRWKGSQQHRTLQSGADHQGQYLPLGHSLRHAGCVTKPLLSMAREHIVMCNLHCIMVAGRLVMQFLEALCGDSDKVLRTGV